MAAKLCIPRKNTRFAQKGASAALPGSKVPLLCPGPEMAPNVLSGTVLKPFFGPPRKTLNLDKIQGAAG